MGPDSLIQGREEIRSILDLACARGEFLILVAPYLRFESHFLSLEGERLRVSATMSHEDALVGLRNTDLHFRFPHGASFLGGSTRMLGLSLLGGCKSLDLSLPKALTVDDQRAAYRTGRVGHVTATICTQRLDLWAADLVNISTTGARLLAHRDLSTDFLSVGEELTVSIPLTEGISLTTPAKVRHIDARTFGLEFDPARGESHQILLNRWVFQRQEEDRDRGTRWRVDQPSPSLTSKITRGGAVPGLLLVSSQESLAGELREVLKGLPPLERVSPTLQGLKDGLARRPWLVFFHLPSLGLDDRHRIKTFVDAAAHRVPFMVLGTAGMGMAPLLELGTELKAAATYQWAPGKGIFFQRLVLGMLRRHHEGTEGPLIPKEEAERGTA